jgi:eukaryotic-like serine/threonine-protein kinase
MASDPYHNDAISGMDHRRGAHHCPVGGLPIECLALVEGETLNGRYRIVRLMGGGGMGAVYEATEIGTDLRVAVKVINSGDLAKDKALIGRFQRETQATTSIDADNIVRVLSTGTIADTGQPFMVMEYLTGEDLSHVFKRVKGQLPPELALRIAAQACLGLEKAHSAHIIHRDIKPANLFLAQQPDGNILVKLLDFGIAKIKMDQVNITDSRSLTRTGSMVGSPLYMSPEQARGSKLIDHRADIWSLGVVLYQSLTGKTPNQDIDALGELIIAICSEPPTPVQQLAPWVPPEVAAIVHRALLFDPGDRFQSAAEMLEAIKPLLPQGWALRPEMIVGINDSQRAQVAPVLPISISNPPPRLISSGSGTRRFTASGARDPSFSSTPGELVESGTPLGIANTSTPGARTVPASRVPLIIGGAVVVGIGLGLGVYKMVTPPAPPVAASAALEPTTATATATASAAATKPRTATTAKPTGTAAATVAPVTTPTSPGLKDKFE